MTRGSTPFADDTGSPTACGGDVGRLGVERIPLFYPGGIQTTFSHGASGGPGRGAAMPSAVEATYSVED